MYCPKCSTLQEDNQKFCRSCGLNLKIIAHLLNDRNDELTAFLDDAKRRKKRLQNWGALVVVLSLMIGAAIPLVIGLGYESNSLVIILAGLAGIILFGGTALAIYADFAPKTAENEQSFQANLPLPPNDKQQLSEGNFQPVQSAVDATTEIFDTNKIEAARRAKLIYMYKRKF